MIAILARLGRLATRLATEVCPDGRTLTECEILCALPLVGKGPGLKRVEIAYRTSYTAAELHRPLKRLCQEGLLEYERTTYACTTAGAAVAKEYNERLAASEYWVRRLYFTKDEDSARHVWASLAGLDRAKSEPMPAGASVEERRRLLEVRRATYIRDNQRRETRKHLVVRTEIFRNELGPFLQLSDQILADTEIEIGSRVEVRSQPGVIRVALADDQKLR